MGVLKDCHNELDSQMIRDKVSFIIFLDYLYIFRNETWNETAQ